jgi:hypothetical protein
MVFVLSADDVIDLDLDLLIRLLTIVDQELARVEAECEKSQDPDSLGLLDRAEGLAGLGFVACQQYLHMTYRQFDGGKKWEAIQAGPRHAADVSYAEVINAAANFWKHRGEWDDRAPTHDETRTRAVLDRIFASSGAYPLFNVLHGLLKPEPSRFANIVPLLEGWRNALIAKTRPDPTP